MAMTLYDILTRASIRLGGEPISSLTADTVDVEVWAAIWEGNLSQALTANTWNFAVKTQELSKLLTAPADPRFKYQFDLPSDFTTARYFLDSAGCRTEDYRIEGNQLLGNDNRIIAVYGRTYTQDEVSELPDWFVNFWVSSLANEAAEKLAGIGSVKQAITAETQALFQKAKVRDAQLAPPVRIGPSRWRAVR